MDIGQSGGELGCCSTDCCDVVSHSRHYTSHPSGVECITVAEHMGFCLGNAMKYIWRADEKGNAVEDLEKARWYIEREISRRSKPPEPSSRQVVVAIEKTSGVQAIYLDGVLKDFDDTLYPCDIVKAAEGAPVVITQEVVDLPDPIRWPESLEALRSLQKAF